MQVEAVTTAQGANLLLRSLAQRRTSEAFEVLLAMAMLEPQPAEHVQVTTSRLGYGGVIWCATTLGPENSVGSKSD